MSELPPGFVLEAQPQTELPPGFIVEQEGGHLRTGPSGDLMTDIPRRLGTAVVDAIQGWVSPIRHQGGMSFNPETARIERAPPPTDEQRQQALQADRSALFNTLGATEYVPETGPGRVLQSGMAAALMAGKPSAMLAGAGAGMGAQTAVEASNAVGLPPQVPAVVGALIGGGAANRLGQIPFGAKPGAVSPETAQMAQMAREKYGIPVTGLQMSEAPFVRKADAMLAKLPFSEQTKQLRQQQDAFNRSVNRTFGEDSPRVSFKEIDAARTRIGKEFDRIAQNTTVKFDQQFAADLSKIAQEAPQILTSQELAPVTLQLKNVLGKVQPDKTISGEAYKALTVHNGPLDKAMRSGNSNVALAAQDIRNALDDALARSAKPEDVAALKEARTQYKALKTVEPLTVRADNVEGARPSMGDVSPEALRGRVNQQYKTVARAAPGDLPLNDLANIGQRFLKNPQDSGTPLGNLVLNPSGQSIREVAKNLAARALLDQTMGRVMRSDAYTERLIKSGTNPASVVLKRPSPLALLLMAERSANSDASRLTNSQQR